MMPLRSPSPVCCHGGNPNALPRHPAPDKNGTTGWIAHPAPCKNNMDLPTDGSFPPLFRWKPAGADNGGQPTNEAKASEG